MNALDIFALVVLLVLVVAAIGILVWVGMMPGRIARERNHPQAEAINVCGWWGVITMGLLLPVAWIWAYTNSEFTFKGKTKQNPASEEGDGGGT